jgi:hypothetical protein
LTPVYPVNSEALWADLEALWALRARLAQSARARYVDWQSVDRRLHGVVQLLSLDWHKAALIPESPAQYYCAAYAIAQRDGDVGIDAFLALASQQCEPVAAGIARASGVRGGVFDKLCASTQLAASRLALQIARYQRYWPATLLDVAMLMQGPDAVTAGLAARLAAETGQASLLPRINQLLSQEMPIPLGWHAWAYALFSERGDTVLHAAVQRQHLSLREALPLLAIRTLPAKFNARLNALARVGDAALAIEFCGWAGCTRAVPWLISLLTAENLGPSAGLAVAQITGAPCAEMPPQGESLDPEVPWPSIKALEQWWRAQGPHFDPDVRYLRGQPVSQETLASLWQSGVQQDRCRVALEWAVLEPTRGVADHLAVR